MRKPSVYTFSDLQEVNGVYTLCLLGPQGGGRSIRLPQSDMVQLMNGYLTAYGVPPLVGDVAAREELERARANGTVPWEVAIAQVLGVSIEEAKGWSKKIAAEAEAKRAARPEPPASSRLDDLRYDAGVFTVRVRGPRDGPSVVRLTPAQLTKLISAYVVALNDAWFLVFLARSMAISVRDAAAWWKQRRADPGYDQSELVREQMQRLPGPPAGSTIEGLTLPRLRRRHRPCPPTNYGSTSSCSSRPVGDQTAANSSEPADAKLISGIARGASRTR